MKKILGIILALTISGIVLAESRPGPYAGIGLGYSKFEDLDILEILGASVDDTDTGWKIYGGYNFSESLGGEMFYADLGSFSASAAKHITVDTKTFGVAGLYREEVGSRVELFGKIGIHNWEADFNVISDSDDIGMMFGLGANINITGNISGRFEYEKFDLDGDDIDMLSVGLQYNF